MKIQRRFAIPTMLFALLICFTIAANAHTQPVQCTNQITACGCTISAPGNYTVENDLSASQGLTLENGCIDITGQSITLQVDQHLFGPGSSDCRSDKPKKNAGVGIHVFPTASHVSIFVPISCGWNYGVESEGSYISWDEPASLYDNVGILFNNATSSSCTTCVAEESITGIEIAGGSGNSFSNDTVGLNTQYGIWLNGTQNNTFFGTSAVENEIAGFYVGCSSTGDVKPLIPCTITPTTGNSFTSSLAAYSKYGFAVEKGSIYNEFLDDSGQVDMKFDFIDGNANCIYNKYLSNMFTTRSPKCIQ